MIIIHNWKKKDKITICSDVLNDNITINSTIDDCDISIIEYNNDLVNTFGRRVIYSLNERINIVKDFDIKKSRNWRNFNVFIDDCDYYSVLIQLKPERKTKKYIYALKIKSLCGKMPSINYGNEKLIFDPI